MKTAGEVLTSVAVVAAEKKAHDEQGEDLRKRIAAALKEAREHPEVSMEDARQLFDPHIPRMSAYELAKEADTADKQ